MTLTARLLMLLAVILFSGACRHRGPAKPSPAATASAALGTDTLVPSPRLIVGRVIAIDASRKFAFVELAADAPPAALASGTELIVRSLELGETARLHASRYVRGRTLGTNIVSGQPSPGDEVVWLAP